MVIELLILPCIGWLVYRQEEMMKTLYTLKEEFGYIKFRISKRKSDIDLL